MIESKAMHTAQPNDADLVAESLAGSQEAFRQIVERYQTLICSLAYSATGSVSQSEDLAQETFVTAWKDLRALREPAKLRSWLCAIVRFRISKQLRRQDREPSHVAEPLELVQSSAAPGAPPSSQAITNEETAILWRSLERIPEMYREPLVLFYREHQSIESVAANLDLTEDNVKQRLSRGRKMLQQEVLAFVEGALERTNPGQAFTLGVLAALPAMTFSAKAAALGAAAKGGVAAAKGATASSVFGWLCGPALGVVCGYLGWRANLKNARTPRERAFITRYAIMIAVAVVVFTASLLSLGLFKTSMWQHHTALLIALGLAITLGWGIFVFASAWRFNRGFAALREEERRLHPDLFQDEPVSTSIFNLSNLGTCATAWEYRSRATFLGLPLVHCRMGKMSGKRFQPAVGWIAFGEVAYGILFANGAVAVGGISVGGASVGIISFGGFGLGLLAFGGLTMGAVAMGGAAIGLIASGGIALGWHAALGGMAAAHELALGGAALGRHVNDDLAREFFIRYHWLDFTQPGSRTLFWTLCFAPVVLQLLVWSGWRRKMVKDAKSS